MTVFNQHSEDQFSFSLQEVKENQHDYFLQSFRPATAHQYLVGKIFKKDQQKGVLFISLDTDGVATSHPQSPFGGLWLDESIPSTVLVDFIQFLKKSIKSLGVSKITLTQAPAAYGSQTALFEYLLFKEGFKLSKILNHQILHGKKKIKKRFESLFSKHHKKAKENRFNVTVGNIQSFTFLHEIATWKINRGHLQEMDEGRLIQQVSTFPERYFVISILHEGIAVAHALAVKLTSNSLYYFYSAINPKNQLRLTGQLMMTYLLKLAVEQKVELLDLGSSEVEDQPNHTLIYFKHKYAESWCNKHTWEIVL